MGGQAANAEYLTAKYLTAKHHWYQRKTREVKRQWTQARTDYDNRAAQLSTEKQQAVKKWIKEVTETPTSTTEEDQANKRRLELDQIHVDFAAQENRLLEEYNSKTESLLGKWDALDKQYQQGDYKSR